MFEEKRGGENGELGEKERADLCYKKLSFEVLETFVCFCCFHCCAVIKAKDRFFSTHHPSSSSSLPLCSFLFFRRLLLFSSKVHLCPRWKALYLLRSLWCLNDDMESKLFSAIPSFILFLSLFGFQQLHLAFPDVTALTASRTGYDRTTHTELNKKQQAWKN